MSGEAQPSTAEPCAGKHARRSRAITQRNGPTGTVKVRFDREYTRFDNLAEGEYPDDDMPEGM